MGVVITSAVILLASLFAILVTVLLVEIVAGIGFLPRPGCDLLRIGDRPQHIAVLVPAHNESFGIGTTVADIKAQLVAGDRLVVIADNCSDDTAVVAAAAGAEVVVRHNLTRIGKGYALDFGLRHLHADPPHIVVMIDADCRLSPHAIGRLAAISGATGRPAQALDLMISPVAASANYRVAEFAWRVRNWVRPLGLSALRLPCRLMGTGMAFPWQVISTIELATAEIAEDQKLACDLVAAGHAPLFCPSAVVTSQFPTSAKGAKTQRQRWEHGHIGLILTVVPRLVGQAAMSGNVGLLALALDLAVPPLALLGLLLIGGVMVSGAAALAGFTSAAFIISSASFIAFVFAVMLCWLTHGRDLLSAPALLSIAPYVLGKLALYGRFLLRKRASRWIRTDRG